MSQVSLQNVGIGFGEVLFRNISFSFGEGDRVGVVGNNGAGKTTLLHCVAGFLEPTEGAILRPKGRRIGYVEQTVRPELKGLTLREGALSAISPEERDSFSWRAEIVLDAFAAPEDMRDRVLSQLSGGWQRLALIARAWASDPDILIIDEPTNHLDLAKIVMLETWLNQEVVSIPLLIVSHDRRFLDTCTNRTLFLRPDESRIYSYPFSKARELLFEDDRALENKRDREVKEMQRLRKSAHNLRQIGVNNYSAAALRKSIQIANRAEAIEDSLQKVHVEQQRDIKLSSRETHSKRLVTIEDLTIKRPDGVPLFQIGSLSIRRSERVVILGRNGTGKTQFVQRLRTAFADVEGARGEGLAIAPSLVIGYIDQNMSQLPENETLRDYLSSAHQTGDQRATALLVSSGFPIGQHSQKIRELSPGQKARVTLLSFRLQEPSFYLMDEPTNNLDIAGQEQLETEILAHEATAVLVSHDRSFVENTGTRFLVIEESRLFELGTPEIFYRALARNVPVSQLSDRLHAL
jgi:ATPase subunit of ABC transporter with duplicated ATPase domains